MTFLRTLFLILVVPVAIAVSLALALKEYPREWPAAAQVRPAGQDVANALMGAYASVALPAAGQPAPDARPTSGAVAARTNPATDSTSLFSPLAPYASIILWSLYAAIFTLGLLLILGFLLSLMRSLTGARRREVEVDLGGGRVLFTEKAIRNYLEAALVGFDELEDPRVELAGTRRHLLARIRARVRPVTSLADLQSRVIARVRHALSDELGIREIAEPQLVPRFDTAAVARKRQARQAKEERRQAAAAPVEPEPAATYATAYPLQREPVPPALVVSSTPAAPSTLTVAATAAPLSDPLAHPTEVTPLVASTNVITTPTGSPIYPAVGSPNRDPSMEVGPLEMPGAAGLKVTWADNPASAAAEARRQDS